MRSRESRRNVLPKRRSTRYAHPEMGGLRPRTLLLRLRGVQPDRVVAPGAPSDPKTVTSVNGKPVSAVAAVPGTGLSQREDAGDIDPPPAAGSRISGRVFDEEGRAVPNAMVRLGVGGTSGGRVNFARRTDPGPSPSMGCSPRAQLHPDRRIPGRGRHDVRSSAGQGTRHGRPHRAGRARSETESEPRGAKFLPPASGQPCSRKIRPTGSRPRPGRGPRRPPRTRRIRSRPPRKRRPAPSGRGHPSPAGWPPARHRRAAGDAMPGKAHPPTPPTRSRAAADADGDTERPAVVGQSQRNVGGRWR